MQITHRALVSGLFLALLSHAGAYTYAAENNADDSKVVAPALLLAENFSANIDVSLYLVSEKLDGVRAYWDGKVLRFRSGRPIHAPAWFIAALPARALDGELWMGRHQFERLSAAVRRQVPDDAEWRKITYHLYELPQGEGDFSTRLSTLTQLLTQLQAQSQATWLKVLPQTHVVNQAALQQQLDEVVRAGGEGLMLHRADAVWQSGRSDVLLKFKPHFDDEAVVIAHEAGQGKYHGQLGALLVRTKEGRELRLGTGLSDQLRRDPPAIGTVVTFRYRDTTNTGLPKFASFLRVREEE
jgi:DNA ligase-1